MTLDLSGLSDISALLSAQNKGNGLRSVRVDAIHPDPNQPRKRFDEASLTELAESIRAVGIIQPPVVSSQGDSYLLISGERRWRAAQLLGLERIDVIVRDDRNARVQLIENIQREELSHWEIFRVIASELEAGATQAGLGRALGKGAGWIGAYAAVSKMPQELVAMLREGRVADITALGQLYRLYKTRPEVARMLLESSEPLTRAMVAAAAASSVSHPATGSTPQPRIEIPDPEIGSGAKEDRVSVTVEPSAPVVGAEHLESSDPIPASIQPPSPLSICIRARYEHSDWIVDYACQSGKAGSRTVRLMAEDGSTRYALLEDLTLQSIECP